MATSDILGLFATPEQYQAQQMASERQQAGLLAGLTPAQLANYGAAIGGQQLGRGLGSLFGAQDPQLQMITRRQQLLSQINPSDPQALMRAAQQAGEMGDPQMALQLTDFANRQASEMALAKQRGGEKSGQGIQEAARINEIETRLATLDPESTEFKALTAEKQRLQRAVRAASGDKFSQLQELYAQRKLALQAGSDQDVQIIDRLINSIAAEKGGDKAFESIVKAERIGVLTDELEELEAANKKDTPEYRRKASVLKSLQGDKAGAPIKELVLGEEIAKLDAFIRDAKDPAAPAVIDAKTKVQLYRDAMKRERPNLDTLGLAKGGKYDGQPVFLDETSRKTFVLDVDKDGKQIEVPYTGSLRGLRGGTEISVGGAEVKVDTGEASKAAGKKIGAELVEVKDKQSALDSIDDALGLLNQGIYAGGYGPAQNFVAKYTGIGDKNKVARTEQFLAFIGDVVVPRLKEFGGNDSEQELAYLNRIMGGQIEMEPAALKNILKQAKIKINRGIERLRKQAESGDEKKPLVSTLPSPQDNTQPQPKPTMRFNPATKKLERVQ
jgi:peroxiredoxin